MFCSKCGAQCADDSKFCNVCGNPMQAAPAAAEPVKAPVATKAPANALGAVRPYMGLILGVVAILALVLFILNTFCILEIPGSVSSLGQSETAYGKISNIESAWKAMDKSLAGVYIGNILFGLINLVIAAVAALYCLKCQAKMPYYDQFVAKYLKVAKPAFYVGAAGVVGVLLQVILFALCTVKESYFGITMSMSVGVPWLSWVAMVIYAGVAALGFLVDGNPFEKKNK